MTEENMFKKCFVYASEVACRKLCALYTPNNNELKSKLRDRFEGNIKNLFSAKFPIKNKLQYENINSLYPKVFATLAYIIKAYRNFNSHIGHEEDVLNIRAMSQEKISQDLKPIFPSDEEYLFIIDILEMYYHHKIYDSFNNNTFRNSKYYGLQRFHTFYEKDSNLSRDGKIFILSFILPKYLFTELLSSCTGYKRSQRQDDENQDDTDVTPFYEKRKAISCFSMPSYDVFYTLPPKLQKFLSYMSTASKIPYELYQYYPDEYEKMKKNPDVPANIQKQSTFTQHAARYIEDRKLFSKIHFIHRDIEKNEQEQATGKKILPGNETHQFHDEDATFPYYITNGNIFCYFKEENGDYIRFRLSAEHLSYIISFFILLNEDPLYYIYEHYKELFYSVGDSKYQKILNKIKESLKNIPKKETSIPNKISGILRHIERYKSYDKFKEDILKDSKKTITIQEIIDNKEKLYTIFEIERIDIEDNIIQYIKKQIQDKRTTINHQNIKEKLIKKIRGIQKKFEDLYKNTPEKDFEYIKEIISLIYLLADIRSNSKQISKDKSIETWQNIFYSIQQSYTKDGFIEALQSQEEYNTENREGLYSQEVKRLCNKLKEDTHKDLLEACYKTIQEIGDRDIELLDTEEHIDKVAHRYKMSLQKGAKPDNFDTKSATFSLNMKDIRKQQEKTLFWKDRKQVYKDWYTEIVHPIDFLIGKEPLEKIQNREDRQTRKQLSKARKIIIERGWYSFLIQKMALDYCSQYMKQEYNCTEKVQNEEKENQFDTILIQPITELLSGSIAKSMRGIVPITIKSKTGEIMECNLHTTDILQYQYILQQYHLCKKIFAKDLDKEKEKLNCDREKLLFIVKKRKDYFNRWLPLLIQIEEHMSKVFDEPPRDDKDNLNFRILVEQYCEKRANHIIEDKQDRFIKIRNGVFHEQLKKDMMNAQEVEAFIREFAKDINCSLDNISRENSKQKKKYSRDKIAPKKSSKKEEEDLQSKIQSKELIDYSRLINHKGISIKNKNK